MSAVLLAALPGVAPAQGVHLKPVVLHAGAGTSSCVAEVTAPLNFSFDPVLGAGQVATAVVTLICRHPEYLGTIELSPGNANNFSRYRQMWKNGTDSSEVLEYNFYTRSDYRTVWGDGTHGTSVLTVGRTVTSYSAVLFAKLKYPPNPVTAGNYSDSIVVTFNVG
jgi:spore coat protein U-like protein